MQKYKLFILNIYTLLFKALRLTLLALFLSVCLLLTNCNESVTNRILTVENQSQLSEKAININTASASELESLPRIGEELARQIIEYREKYGKFRRTENLILVRGMSDKKFRELRDLVKVE
jgi:competence ComEA-like helix-hairpin-helix protein